MMLSEDDDRRCIMTVSVQQIHPVAHLPLVLGVLRRLEVAPIIDRLLPPHPAHVLSSGRGVEALVLAILDGDHALYKVGRRLDERGMLELLQPGLTRASLHDYRLAPSLSKHWRSLRSRRPGSIRILRRLPSMGPMRMPPSSQGPHGRPTGTAKTAGMISNRCSSVSVSVGMAASPSALGCVMATAAIVWKRPWRLRSVWPWA